MSARDLERRVFEEALAALEREHRAGRIILPAEHRDAVQKAYNDGWWAALAAAANGSVLVPVEAEAASTPPPPDPWEDYCPTCQGRYSDAAHPQDKGCDE